MRQKKQTDWSGLSQKTVTEKLLKILTDSLRTAFGADAVSSSDLLRVPVVMPKVRVLVAFSGGRDSMALLHLAHKLSKRKNSPIESVKVVHIHHSLQKEANAWARFCRAEAEKLGLEYRVIRVQVKNVGDGIEAAARKARYEAIASAAKSFDCNAVLVAQHQDDLLETFLIQWMRGAGTEGLSAFPMVKNFYGAKLIRPFIHTPRIALETFLKGEGIDWVDDPSNDDVTYLRNAIRHEVLPVMDKIRPGFRSAAARSVEIVAELNNTLAAYAEEDLKQVTMPDGSLSIERFLKYSSSRQALILREWIESYGILPPSKAKLDEALRQTKSTGTDTKLAFSFGKLKMYRAGGSLVMRNSESVRSKAASGDETQVFHGPGAYRFAGWQGTLFVYKATIEEPGFPQSLLDKGLCARERHGGEKIKLYPNRPSKFLKYWYQEKEIPEFDRKSLPLVWVGGELAFASGLGPEVRLMTKDISEERFILRWTPDKTLLDLL